jgi:enterochelin esterase-like enzyme
MQAAKQSGRAPSRRHVLAGGTAIALTIATPVRAQVGTGERRVITLPEQPSKYVAPRKVTVVLPADYKGVSWDFPVLYVLDGQKIGLDQAGRDINANLVNELDMLASQGKARDAIVVGVWSSKDRLREFLPGRALSLFPERFQAQAEAACNGKALSDNLMRYLVEELKPAIDRTFRTLTSPGDTGILGSGMGGLAALYAFAYGRKTFGNAACISGAEPLLPYGSLKLQPAEVTPIEKALARSFENGIPRAGKRRLYLDYGNVGKDLFSTGFHGTIEPVLWDRGFREGANFVADGAPLPDMTEHSEGHRLRAALSLILQPRPFEPALPGEDF